MKTRVCRLYGQRDLRIEEMETGEPGAEEVLVVIGAGGICGSDLHYYQDGGFGPIKVREPIILGHEIAGTVKTVGEGVKGLSPGDRVAVNPSRPCNECRFCREGLRQHCLNMRFFGSALRFPHEQGGFRDLLVAQAFQCEKIEPEITLAEAAVAEPLAVCLHARNRAGDIAGKRVLVTGAGPIGALVTAACAHAGASEIVVTDLQDVPLSVARQMGATHTVNVRMDAEMLGPYTAEKGAFDLAFECSAAAPALKTAIEAVRPQGTIVQLGVTGDLPLPVNVLVGKEINLIGSHRFDAEFAEAVRLINSRAIDVRPLISASYPLEEALTAFEHAGDRRRAVKVQLSFAAE
ncbi:L-idonate 5-dehydrogenase [Chelativorans sp. SCAU2101]|jgi:Threonine dehydrogenase and related Zn-dependent dehydrogenases|uniref:L-idonate 5-dehydrogenase n=1 Tax=Chelativorans petroleitrophicus TaxID=2975484 RepID=A0A9X2XA53_9HYPH|nr:L-idonate 5-dehydrogenase [Chelativorans petroleitrophicus]MCT8990480.1 L-idonate 5-dehydrogenase [Chelativorans petroleitrophicus]